MKYNKLYNPLEFHTFHPLVKANSNASQPLRNNDDDKLTLGDALKKGIAPKGMKPAWSPQARAKYETCIKPEIEKYKKTVEKINTVAQENFEGETKDYLAGVIGFGALSELVKGVGNGSPITTKIQWFTPEPKYRMAPNRIFFYFQLGVNSWLYVSKRQITKKRDLEAFVDATNASMEKVNDCREKNPYDMWVQSTPNELKAIEFFESLRPKRQNLWLKLPFRLE